jgi:hypothetical protein
MKVLQWTLGGAAIHWFGMTAAADIPAPPTTHGYARDSSMVTAVIGIALAVAILLIGRRLWRRKPVSVESSASQPHETLPVSARLR